MLRCLAVLLLGGALIPAGLSAAPVDVEGAFEFPLDGTLGALDLWEADVEVAVVARGEEPAVAVRRLGEGPAPRLELLPAGTTRALRRVDPPRTGPEAPAPARLGVRVRLPFGSALEVSGRDLLVVVGEGVRGGSGEPSSPVPEEVRAAGDPPVGSGEAGRGDGPAREDGDDPSGGGFGASGSGPRLRTPMRFTLRNSELELSGPLELDLELEDSRAWLRDLVGGIEGILVGGSIEIDRFEGAATLGVAGTVVGVADWSGPLLVDAEAANLRLERGRGRLELRLADADAEVRAWEGPAILVAARSRLRFGEGSLGNVRLTAEGGDVTLADHLGACTVALAAGRLVAERACEPLQLRARGQSVVRGADLGRFEAQLAETDLTLARVAVAEVELERGSGSFAAVSRLGLVGRATRIDAVDVERVAKLELTDSDLLLELRPSPTPVSLVLRGTGDAEIDVEGPCVVEAASGRSLSADALRVDGCDFATVGADPRRNRAVRRRFGTQRPTWIRVELDSGVECVVRGR